MTRVHITAMRQPPRAYLSITMAAHVIALLPRGGRRVRLANNHELDVSAAAGRQAISLLGDVVFIERVPGQLHGWRLGSRESTPSAPHLFNALRDQA